MTTVQDIPSVCGCQIMSKAIHLPTPEQRIPTCKNKVTRMTRLNNGHKIFSCGSHVKTIKRCYRTWYVDCMIRQKNTDVFVLLTPPPPPPPPPLTPQQIARRNEMIARFERNTLKHGKKVNSYKLPCDENSSFKDCSICMEYISIDNGGHLPCKHSFHNKCISNWLNIKHNCPYCRTDCNHTNFIVK
jgi:hypothetical protein